MGGLKVMDVGSATFSIYGQLLPILASAGAGLSTLALLAGTAKTKRRKDSQLPADPELRQPKYVLAYDQLVEHCSENSSSPSETQSAIHLSITAFEQHKSVSMKVNPKS
jgi:hypothetical protein